MKGKLGSKIIKILKDLGDLYAKQIYLHYNIKLLSILKMLK